MLKFNSFRAQRYLRSRFIEGKYLLASEATDIELELIDFCRTLVKHTLGDVAVESGWKTELYKIQTKVLNKVGLILTVDSTILDLVNVGDKVFKNGNFVTDITAASPMAGTITVSNAAAININDNIEILTSNSLLVNVGEAWYDGLPFLLRSGKDELVSGSSLGAGIVLAAGGGPANISMQDDPSGRGKIITFSDGGVTPAADYQVVISAIEEVITNVDDPFLKNVNVPESTEQKLRLTYRINVVPKDDQSTQPVPYTDSTVDGNLTNYIDVIPQSGANGSEVSRSVITGSEQIDGRNLEIIIRNNASAANPSYSGSPVGNLIPIGTSEQSEYTNGTFIDSNGQSYHLNLIFNDTVANQVVLRLDSEVDQPQPEIIVGKPYRLVKREVYVTDDNAGTPLGKVFWPIANVSWDATDGFVHESKVQDLRNPIQALTDDEDTTTVKFNLKLTGGGTITAEPSVKATGTIEVINNTFDVGDEISINGKAFVYNVDWMAGVDTDATALAITNAINNSLDPLIANIVTASVMGSIITITAVQGGTAGNSLALAESDGATDNFTLSGANLTGGVDGTPGELVWTDDFKIVNPNGPTQTILASESVIREGGAIAYIMDLENGGAIGDGNLPVTTTTNGTSISLSGTPDLSKVKIGNTLLVGQEPTSITAIDDINKTLEVFPALVGAPGSATIYQDTYASGTAPVDPRIFVLAVKTGTIIQVTGRGEFEPGESSTSGVPIQLLQYIGSTGETDSSPNYTSNNVLNDGDNLTLALSKVDMALGDLATFVGATSPNDTSPAYASNNYITDGDDLVAAISDLDAALFGVDGDLAQLQSDFDDLLTYVGTTAGDTSPDYSSNNYVTDGDDLTTAIGDLDAALASVTDAISDRENQDRNAKLVRGGTWSWDLATTTLAWSADANIQVGALAESVNLISAGSASLTADGQVAYVELNRAGPGGALTVSTALISALVVTDNTFIIARRLGNTVLVGHTFLLKDGEYLELDGALAEINRRLNQLRITEHESAVNKARIAASDITQLDSTTLSQELNNFLLNFSGAVINFTTGAVLKEDDATALGLNFTPFSLPVGEYVWYSIGLIPSGVDASNRITAQVQVTAASASDAVQANAPFPIMLGTKKLGAIQVWNDGGTITVVDIRRLGVGSGSGGSGTGDASSITTRLEDKFADSIYELMTAIDFAQDEEDHVDLSSTGDYSLVSNTFEFASAGLTLVSTQLLSDAFLDSAEDIPRMSLSLFWDEDAIDTAAIYEVSRNGGVDWQTITMEQVGDTDTFEGDLTFTEETPATLQEYAVANADGSQVLNLTTAIKLSQIFTVTDGEVVRQLTMYLAKTGSPLGLYTVSIVRDNAGSPSTDLADLIASSVPQDVTTLSAGNNAVSISLVTPLAPGSYHIVLETNDAYKASFSAGVTQIAWRSDESSPTPPEGQQWNGSAWSAIGGESFVYQVSGRLLDLRIRVTSSVGSVGIAGYGVFYSIQDQIALGVKNREVKYFQAVAQNLNSFTLGFLPDPDLLEVYYVEAGQTFVYPAFVVQGHTVTFPANTFYNNGIEANVTLVFSQVKGSSFDNSDSNAALLAANHLGSSDAAIDKSAVGRGIILRRPDGTLREIRIDNNDNIQILTVP